MKQISDNQIAKLKLICNENVFTDVSLADLSRWQVGGMADCLIRPKNSVQVSNILAYLSREKIPYLIIGSTSNLLFSDEGVRAVIIQIAELMSDFQIEENVVRVQAGKWVPGFARAVALAGLSGIEHTAGIPGTIGGLICMNGGSQRKGIGTQVWSISAISPLGEIKRFNKDQCKFGYRSSVFQKNKYTVVEVELKFTEQKKYTEIRNEMLDILRSRRLKFPQKFPNCGSTFISNPDIYKVYGPPGKIIEELGLKGYRIGGAEVSSVHANFINNKGDAKAKDILALIQLIKECVYQYTGFEMDAEVKFVNQRGVIEPAHKVKVLENPG